MSCVDRHGAAGAPIHCVATHFPLNLIVKDLINQTETQCRGAEGAGWWEVGTIYIRDIRDPSVISVY